MIFRLALVLWPLATFAKNIQLVLNWKPEAEFGGFYEAERAGAFDKHHLKVQILPGGVGTPAVQMVAAGQAEFGIASADEVVLSQDRGADIVALYAVYQTNPQGFMVRRDRGIHKLSQVFESGLLAVQKGLPYFLFLEKKYGPIRASVVPYQGGIAQMAENKQLTQQCFVTSEPILAEKKKLPVQTFLIAESGFNPYATVVVASRGYWEKNRKTAADFLQAIDEGWKKYLQDPGPTNKRMHELNPSMDLDTLNKSAQIQKPLILTAHTKHSGIGSMTEERWKQLAGQLEELKLIKKAKPARSYFSAERF